MRWLLTAMLALVCVSTQIRAETWDETVVAAKREGTLVVIGPAHEEVRKALPAAFKKRFGIDMQYLGGPAGLAATRLQAERSAGIYTADVGLAAIQTLAGVFYQQKMLDPIKPLLVLPEILDGSKWRRGELWFPDPDHQYVLRLFSYVSEVFSVNTDYVKPADMVSARNLFLDPKWKGKIAVHDPTATGTGSNVAAQFYVQLGEEATRKLYVDQQPVISRDERQLTDWLLRGVYPIVIGSDYTEVEDLSSQIPVKSIYGLPDLSAPLSGGNGMLIVFNKAPHPNAAKVFVNWLASREGLEIYSRAATDTSTRNDLDESFLPQQAIPKPGVQYFDAYDWEFSTSTKAKVRLWLKDLLGR
jgi:iron(III) transport system substrate-binding protein